MLLEKYYGPLGFPSVVDFERWIYFFLRVQPNVVVMVFVIGAPINFLLSLFCQSVNIYKKVVTHNLFSYNLN